MACSSVLLSAAGWPVTRRPLQLCSTSLGLCRHILSTARTGERKNPQRTWAAGLICDNTAAFGMVATPNPLPAGNVAFSAYVPSAKKPTE